jgi:hypothetical protein
MTATPEQRQRAQDQLDLHARMAAMNPGAWMRPRTSRKRRYAQDVGLTRIEGLAQMAYDLRPRPLGRETSTRGDNWRADWEKRKLTVSEDRAPKYMYATARRAAA